MKKITIGRSRENDICYENVPTISSFHAEISIDSYSGKLTYSDFSTNGSWINGEKVHNTSRTIRRGDNIILPGNVQINWNAIPCDDNERTMVNPQPVNVHIHQQNYQHQNFNQQGQQQQSNNNNAKPWDNREPYREQFVTDRGLLKYIFLSIITFSIYHIVVLSKISHEINCVARKDTRNTLHYCLIYFLLSPITFGIMGIVWFHQLSDRIGNELRRRNIPYKFNANDFWLWDVFGILILIGPFVYTHKLMHAMNLLNESYNEYGE